MNNKKNPHVVNVYIHDNNIPSPKKIAEKYNIEYNSDDEEERIKEENEEENENEEGRIRSDSLEYDEIKLNNDINNNNKINDLIIKLDKKNREIEKLCVLLEAVSVVPGADPGRYMEIIDGGKEEVIDYRDSKIVSLAKKCRNLTVALNKERSLSRNSTSIISQLQDENERLKKELHLVSSPAARAAAVREIKSADIDSNRDLKKELIQQQKLTDELRKKYQQSQEESKKLTRALVKELGEGVTIEEAVDDGWRGRAQTIVMLKAKIRKLESGVSSGTTPQGKRKDKRYDVDRKAEEELNNMVSERQQAVEFLTEDHARLTEEAEQLKNKVQKYKARVRALESDSSTHKQQLKVLVEKTESDDILIEALQEEIQSLRQSNDDMKKKLQQQQQQLSQTTTLRSMKMNENGTGMIPAITSHEGNEHEILRLKRLCKQQAAQIETQETVIQQLRSTLPKTTNKR